MGFHGWVSPVDNDSGKFVAHRTVTGERARIFIYRIYIYIVATNACAYV